MRTISAIITLAIVAATANAEIRRQPERAKLAYYKRSHLKAYHAWRHASHFARAVNAFNGGSNYSQPGYCTYKGKFAEKHSKKLYSANSKNWARCMKACAAIPHVTGCSRLFNRRNQGCYVTTKVPITGFKRMRGHQCKVFNTKVYNQRQKVAKNKAARLHHWRKMINRAKADQRAYDSAVAHKKRVRAAKLRAHKRRTAHLARVRAAKLRAEKLRVQRARVLAAKKRATKLRRLAKLKAMRIKAHQANLARIRASKKREAARKAAQAKRMREKLARIAAAKRATALRQKRR